MISNLFKLSSTAKEASRSPIIGIISAIDNVKAPYFMSLCIINSDFRKETGPKIDRSRETGEKCVKSFD